MAKDAAKGDELEHRVHMLYVLLVTRELIECNSLITRDSFGQHKLILPEACGFKLTALIALAFNFK